MIDSQADEVDRSPRSIAPIGTWPAQKEADTIDAIDVIGCCVNFCAHEAVPLNGDGCVRGGSWREALEGNDSLAFVSGQALGKSDI